MPTATMIVFDRMSFPLKLIDVVGGFAAPSAHISAFPPLLPELIAVSCSATAETPWPRPGTPATPSAVMTVVDPAVGVVFPDARLSYKPAPDAGVKDPPTVVAAKYPCTSMTMLTVPPVFAIVTCPDELKATCTVFDVAIPEPAT
ncbi:hypothetical protein ACTJKO_00495 [Curtobacterium sp. 22159]|uniref:hypothetical protein n=1 Tax=Curtobacterium sp. 22159 TaxID=3453882 RepID=UPI003F854CEF